MSTPGRVRALKALAAKKRANVRRVAAGKKPLVAGKGGKQKKVSAKSIGLTKKKAKESLSRKRKGR